MGASFDLIYSHFQEAGRNKARLSDRSRPIDRITFTERVSVQKEKE